MAVDMKEMIAQAAGRLILEKKVKKLTVKDIVEECSITRQTFYYHFEDIPDLFRWIFKERIGKTASGMYGTGRGGRKAQISVPDAAEREALCASGHDFQLSG